MLQEAHTFTTPSPLPIDFEPSLLSDVCSKVSFFLHDSWISCVSDGGLNVMLLSRKFTKSVQRQIFFHPNGDVQLIVHCVPLPVSDILKDVKCRVKLNSGSVGAFVDRCIEIVNAVRKLEICSGLNLVEQKHLWSSIPTGRIDSNPYQENRYHETLRAVDCEFLVEARRWHCGKCENLRRSVKRRAAAFSKEEAHPSTPNIALSESQKDKKLKDQQKKMQAALRRLDRLEKKFKEAIAAEGVNVSSDISDDLVDILRSNDLNPTQSFFLQQQLKASKAKSASGIRWHPSMIRFALALHMASPACYETARDSGMIKLPSQRTLYDYTHVNVAKEGVDDSVLDDISKVIRDLPHPYQKYHVLSCDEMHICQNLVYNKSTGEMLGYVKLDEAFNDIASLEKFLECGNSLVKPELATKMLCFMVKGVSSSVKEVVASFSVNRLSTEILYSHTWLVINRCERAGICIVAFVSDGYSVNRSFIQRHKPAKVSKSGLIYATVNKSAPERLLYFMSDVAHLLKTIRNSLNNSRVGKKTKRCLQKGGEKMLWQTIIDLYNENKSRNIRKSYKLTAQNIFIDSYSGMSVSHAAAVLSKTVAKDVEDMNWPNTKQLVEFIRRVNDWFDCLNGAFSLHGVKTKNPNLNPYRLPDDPRFEDLMGFLQYLADWKEAVYSLDALAHNLTESFADPLNDSYEPVPENEREDNVEPSEENKAAKKLLPAQTLDGIEITTMAFIECTKFLLEEGTKYVNARVFSQDHLEQHFSKQRMRGGGSSNPNYGRFLQNNKNIHLQGQLGVKRKKGNTEDLSGGMQITSQPLPKRKRSK